MLGYYRIAAAAPELRTADIQYNTGKILDLVRQGCGRYALLVFPELAVTGGDCGDLFFHELLLNAAETALKEIAAATADSETIIVVGLPALRQGKLYNALAVLQRGEVKDLACKPRLSLSERRYFEPGGRDCRRYAAGNLEFGVAFHFDPSGSRAALTVRAGLECWRPGNGVSRKRKLAVLSEIAETAELYAGGGEDPAALIGIGGEIVAEGNSAGLAVADLDFSRLSCRRRRRGISSSGRCIELIEPSSSPDLQFARLPRQPFLPADSRDRPGFCREIFDRQAAELRRRAGAAGAETLLVGVSGGLDSTLALLAATEAAGQAAGLKVLAVSMPGFGTTGRTAGNAEKLAAACGAEFRVIDIVPAVHQHFSDIGHDPEKHDTTFENIQARERTQILFDLANSCCGLVVGTGDLSEIALGWSTFGGDHLSMYSVNAELPKTVIPEILRVIAAAGGPELAAVLEDIIATPVSPELLPPAADGSIRQQTEEIIGPYLLHDFFLYHFAAGAADREKLEALARQAWGSEFTEAEITGALEVFFRRFFRNQFKRNCAPETVRLGEISLDGIDGFRLRADIDGILWQNQNLTGGN